MRCRKMKIICKNKHLVVQICFFESFISVNNLFVKVFQSESDLSAIINILIKVVLKK